MGHHEIESFCQVKNLIKKTKQKPTEWENIFTTLYLTEGYYPKYRKNSRNKKQTNQKMQFLKWHTYLNRKFSPDETQMTEKH